MQKKKAKYTVYMMYIWCNHIPDSLCTKQVGWGTKCRMAWRTYKEKTTKEEKGRQQGMIKLENERVNKQDYSAAPNAEVSWRGHLMSTTGSSTSSALPRSSEHAILVRKQRRHRLLSIWPDTHKKYLSLAGGKSSQGGRGNKERRSRRLVISSPP